MNIPEILDNSLTTAITIGGAGFALWGHYREMEKERQRAKKLYADAIKKEYAAERDFGHIKRDIDQLKANIDHLNQESDQRLHKLEMEMGKISVSLEVLKELLRARKAD